MSADGLSIATGVGITQSLTYLFAVPAAPAVAAAADHNDTSRTPTALADGNRTAAITLAGFRSLGQVRAHAFTYNSTAADPRPIVAAEVTFAAAAGLPPLLEGRLEVNGVRVAGPVFTSTVLRDTRDDAALPPLAAGGTIRQALQFDASDLATGDHGFRYIASAQYDCSKVGAAVDGRLVMANSEASPFGAGWTLNGLQKLTEQPDGRVVIDEGDGTVKSFDNRFLPGVGQPVPWPLAMAVDDFNGDGHLDAAVPMGDFGTIQIFLGDGKGKLTFLVEYDSGIDDQPEAGGRAPDAEYIETGDFNGDGNRDLAVINQLSNRIQIFPGIGDGTFGSPSNVVVTRPQAVAVADFNRDGHEDLAVATSAGLLLTSRTFVFFGDGSGAFPVSRAFDLGQNQTAVQVADFNNDGWTDIAVLGTRDTLVQELAILRNDAVVDPATGMVAFVPVSRNAGAVRFTAGRFGMAVADYDGDGNQDVAVSNAREDINIFWGDGAGAMPTNSGALTPGVGETSSLRALDVDKDGSPDIVMSSRTFGTVGVLLYDGARRFVSGPVTPVTDPGVGVTAIQPGDFDEDGSADLVAGVGNADDDATQKIFVLKGGNDRFHPPGGDFSELTRTASGFERRMTDGTVFVFDAAGQLISRTDRNGNTTNYTYDAEGRIASISDPADPTRSTSFDYTAGTITGAAGRTTFYLVDANGQLTAVTNPDGGVARFVYDANNRLISQASERGFVTTQDYGFAGQWIGSGFPDGASISAQISQSLGLADLGIGLGTEGNPLPYARPNETATLTDALDNVYTMRFNEFSAPVEVTDPIGRSTILTRDADNLVTRVDAPSDGELPDESKPGRVITEIDYDTSGNVTARREAAGTVLERATRFEYEPAFNRVTKITDPTNTAADPQCGTAGVTCFVHDANGNQTQVTAFVNGAAFTRQSATYDARGLQATRTDAEGNTTKFFYDALGLLERLEDAELNDTLFAYDTAGNLKTRTEGAGTPAERVTSFTYDAMNRVLTETDGAGGTTTTRYDATGNVAETEDATGIVTSRVYDERNRLTDENDPASGPVARTYDASGNLKTVANALGKTVTLVYDTVNRVERTTDPLLKDRLFSSDAQDNLSTVTDARGNITTFAFDLLKRKIRRTNPLPAPEIKRFTYDSRNNLIKTEDAKGQTIERSYDELSRLVTIVTKRIDLTVEDTITFTYDDNGNRLSAADGDSSLAFTYDKLNRIKTAETIAAVGTVQPATVLTSVYDPVGNRTGLTHGPDVPTVEGEWTYGHDGNGRLTSLVHPAGDPGNPIGLEYDLVGRLTTIAFPNGVTSSVDYEPATGRPARIAHANGPTEIAAFDYGYRGDGLVQSITEPAGTRNFTYDDPQQVTSGGFAAALESYTYDAEGNRMSSHLSANHEHDSANRLTSDDSFCYAYDASGNLETKTEKVSTACTGGVTTFTWDVRNRLVRIEFPDTTYAAYRYDANGRRIEKDVNATVTRYVYDGDAILLEYDGANALVARYGHGTEVDKPLSLERGGQSFYYHTDHLGTIRRVSDATGAAADSYDYEAFGRFETRVETVPQPYAFTGREFDAESGLHFYRARYYDAAMGRFTSEDPIGFDANDLNLYRYVINIPTMLTDPTGQETLSTYAIITSASFGAGFGAGFGIVNEAAYRTVFTIAGIRTLSCGNSDPGLELTETLAKEFAVTAIALAAQPDKRVATIGLVGILLGTVAANLTYISKLVECIPQ